MQARDIHDQLCGNTEFFGSPAKAFKRASVRLAETNRDNVSVFKIGRNEKCKCNSGMKFKNCCKKKAM